MIGIGYYEALAAYQREELMGYYADPASGKMREAGVMAVSVDDIADPATATTDVIATKVNEILAALRTAGMLKPSPPPDPPPGDARRRDEAGRGR